METLIASIVAIVGKIIPDPEARAKAQIEILKLHQAGELAGLNAAVQVLVAEAQGNWLQKSWRPILMLTFGGLIVARWLGWAAPGLSEAEYLKLWSIVELGLGGYVIGRSVEKTAPAIVQAIKGVKND
jgi:hypothetical protein